MAREVKPKSALSGYRILDITDKKGLLCARLLADMGADVIRIEPPSNDTPPDYLNNGKRCISLNLETETGRELFIRLMQKSDIIVESYPPGYLEKLGLDYDTLKEINQGLTMASITDFGLTGPYRDYKASDLVASALGGQMSVCGDPDKPPLKPYGNQTDYTASLNAAIGIMLALWQRHTSGKGQHLDISIQECTAAVIDHVLVRYRYEDTVAKRQGSLYWNNAFRIFPCKDGYILLSLLQNWNTLVEWLDSEGMAGDLTDEKWHNRETREKNIDHIIAILEKWTLNHSVDELVEKGQLMRFPWAKVATIPDLLDNPQLKERGFWVEAADPVSGLRFKLPGAPVKMSVSPWQTGSQIPHHSEHNKEIYGGELGLSLVEIETLTKEGVL